MHLLGELDQRENNVVDHRIYQHLAIGDRLVTAAQNHVE
jgi:hypothetical protein